MNFTIRFFFLSISAILFFNKQVYSQKNRQELGLLIYNVGFGGFTAGVGALFNKEKEHKVLSVFWRGFKYGCIGGGANYAGKRFTHSIHLVKDPISNETNQSALLWAWPSKIVHSIGSSIIENAAKNDKNVFTNFRMPVGFVSVSLSVHDKIMVRAKLMPISFITFSSNLLKSGNHLHIKETLLLGTPYFVTATDNFPFRDTDAYQLNNNIIVKEYANTKNLYGFLISHEHIHVLQEREYLVFNQWLYKPYNNLVNQDKKIAKFLKKYIFPDLPYFLTVYQLFNYTTNNYYKNLFELEAEHFATNRYIRR